jgi:hypothetical protein
MMPGCAAPSAPMVVLPVLPLVEFDTIFSAMGLSLSVSGATIFPTFTVPMNNIKMTIPTNPALANFRAYEILSSNAKKGNSKGENDDIVNSIKMPEITVASTRMMSLALRLVDVPDEALGEAEGDAPDNGGDI